MLLAIAFSKLPPKVIKWLLVVCSLVGGVVLLYYRSILPGGLAVLLSLTVVKLTTPPTFEKRSRAISERSTFFGRLLAISFLLSWALLLAERPETVNIREDSLEVSRFRGFRGFEVLLFRGFLFLRFRCSASFRTYCTVFGVFSHVAYHF